MSYGNKSGVRIRVFGLPSDSCPSGSNVDATGVFGTSVRLDQLPTHEDALGSSSSFAFSPAASPASHAAIPPSVSITPLSLGELLDNPILTASTASQGVRATASGAPNPGLSRQQTPLASPLFSQQPPNPAEATSFSLGQAHLASSLPPSLSFSNHAASPSSPPPGAPPLRLWVQVSNLSSSSSSVDVLRQIGEHFKIHPVTIADLQSSESREKLEVFQSYLFLVIHSAVAPTPTIFDIVQQEQEELAAAQLAEEQGEPSIRRRHVVIRYASTVRNPFHVASDDSEQPLSFADHENPFETEMTSPSRQSTGGSYVEESRTGIFRAAGLRTTPIQLIVFPNLVLSFHQGRAQSEINSVCRRLDQLSDSRMDTGQWLMHAMLDVVTSTLRPAVDDAEREVDRLEELIYALAGEEYADLLKRMGLTRRRLVMLKQQIKSKQSILNSLIGRDWQSVAASVQTPYLRDVYDHTETMLVKVECASEVLTALQDTYLAQQAVRSERISQDVNHLMKKFSAVATIILPLSLISGIMGMNVMVPSNIGEENTSWSDLGPFFSIIAVMVVVAVLSALYFRRKGYM